MLLDYFKFQEQPFGVTPDPRFFYPSASHREALASLVYGVQSERAFMALVAQPGMGKTMLLFNLLQQLGDSARTAFLFQTQCDSREFLGYLLTDLGIKVRDYDPIRMHENLKAELLKEARAGRKVVVVVDEAQNLSTPVLETIRLLSDFENPSRKLLQIILAGQPQLAGKIASPELVQLRQRLSLIIHIKPLSRPEVATYIARRLQVGGYAGPALFSPEAVGAIAARSGGIPRIINTYCFNALSIACATQKRIVDGDMVREVIRDLEMVDLFASDTEPEGDLDPVPIDLPVFAVEAPRPAQAAFARSNTPEKSLAAAADSSFVPVPAMEFYREAIVARACDNEHFADSQAGREFASIAGLRENLRDAAESFAGVRSIGFQKCDAAAQSSAIALKNGIQSVSRWTESAARTGSAATTKLARLARTNSEKVVRHAGEFTSRVVIPATREALSTTSRTLSRARVAIIKGAFAVVLFGLRASERLVHSALSLIRKFEARPPAPTSTALTREQASEFSEFKAEGASL